MLVVNLTSPQFLHFESILLITVMAAFLSEQTMTSRRLETIE